MSNVLMCQCKIMANTSYCMNTRVQPASCYRKVAGLIPLVCISNQNQDQYQSILGQDTEPQTANDVLVSTLHGSHCHQ